MEDIDPKKIREQMAEKREEDLHVRICPENEAAAFYSGRADGYRKALFDIAQLALISVAVWLGFRSLYTKD